MANLAVRLLLKYRNQLIVLLTPLLLLPLPLVVKGQEALCGYVMILMAVYWCTEAMPIPATACIPVFLFPMLGLLSTGEVVANYMKETTMMFIGGLTVAVAVEKSNLHKRIATKVLLNIGTEPRWLMLGFMLPTWFLSMWISNTATSAMMLPMVEAVLDQLDPNKAESVEDEEPVVIDDPQRVETAPETMKVVRSGTIRHVDSSPALFDAVYTVPMTDAIASGDIALKPMSEYTHHNEATGPGTSNEERPRDIVNKYHGTISEQRCDEKKPGKSFVLNETDPEVSASHAENPMNHAATQHERMAKGLTLCVAYAANVGGTATLTGTSPNLIMKGQADEIWEARGLPSPVDFPSWMIYGLPIAAMSLLLLWLWMQVYFLGLRTTCGCCQRRNKENDKAVRALIEKEYLKLGRMRFAEIAVSLLFAMLVMLWFFRDPDFLRGWARGFPYRYVGDAVPALLIAVSLYIIPNSIPTSLEKLDTKPPGTLMDWTTMQHKMPWGTLLLFGGGFALADAATKSGLAPWIGEQLTVFSAMPGWVMVLVLCLIVSMLTEITSNSATCTILMPIVASMAEGIGKNPLYLMFPIAISTSFAFMLPVATPPNAIAFSFGRLKVIDMVKAGVFINILCVFVVTLATHTWGMTYFNLDVPPWDDTANTTVASYLN